MTIAANFHFVRGGKLISNFQNEGLRSVLEEKANIDLNKVTRSFFVAKVVPILIYCGASIITGYIDEEQIHYYEVKVTDYEKFVTSINDFVEQIISI